MNDCALREKAKKRLQMAILDDDIYQSYQNGVKAREAMERSRKSKIKEKLVVIIGGKS